MNSINYIKELIKQGENQQLDFKFEIADSKKIARTFSAFANTDGGKLLVGVKDNGSIAGIRSEEEFHMLEAASQMYCKPQIQFLAKEWIIEGKTILEATIKKRVSKIPIKAQSHNGKWMAYVRVHDQNLLANRVLLKVWKHMSKKTPVQLTYSDSERTLLNYLNENGSISLSKFTRISLIQKNKAENILVNLILLGIIEIKLSEKQCSYILSEKFIKNND